MINKLIMRCNKFREILKDDGISRVLNELFYLNREVVSVVKDLSELKVPLNQRAETDINFIEVSSNIIKKLNLKFPLKSRYYQMLTRLEYGYIGFMITRGEEVIGDVWGTNPRSSDIGKDHPDLKKLDIKLNGKDVYMFDLYLKPDVRGGALANFLMISAMQVLKNKSVVKVYGYYVTKNYPALWLHKMLKFKELNRFNTHRFFYFKRSVKKIKKTEDK